MSNAVENTTNLDFDALLGEAIAKRGVLDEVRIGEVDVVEELQDFLSRGDDNFTSEQRGVMDESDNKDYEFYLAEAVKSGLLAPQTSELISKWPTPRRNLAIAHLQGFITPEKRNYEVLKEALALGTVTEDDFRQVAGFEHLDERTLACNRVHTWNRVKKGDNFAEAQHTLVLIGEEARLAAGLHPLADRYGQVHF